MLDFLGAASFHDYFDRAARLYGVDLGTMQASTTADTSIVRVAKPLLMLHALDDLYLLSQIRHGRHDGGAYSLAYRDTIREHPHVRALIVDRGDHAGMLYLSDPHWFGLVTLMHLKHCQARDATHMTAAVPPLDVLASGQVQGQTATYRIAVRNHGPRPIGPVDVQVELPAGARLERCWAGSEGLARRTTVEERPTWALPLLFGGKSTAGPLVAAVDVSRVKAGFFEATIAAASLDEPGAVRAREGTAIPQRVRLRKLQRRPDEGKSRPRFGGE